MIEAILWDNDGVLVDTETVYLRANRKVLSEIGIHLTTEQFIEWSLKRGESVLELAKDKGYSSEQIEALRAKRNHQYMRLLKQGVRVIDGLKETLENLSNKVRMGIVTSAHRKSFELMHQNSGILPYFEFVLTRDDYTRSKPDPEPYLKAIQQNCLKPNACVIIEDAPRGFLSAKAAWIRCIIVPNALTKDCDFTGAYRVLDHVRKIPAVINNLKGS
jgi:HAD superfamily hydrolase (TIGR01509 family)